MNSSNAWAEFSYVFRRTREAYVEHEKARSELKALMPEDAKEAIGHGLRAKRSKSGAISFDLMMIRASLPPMKLRRSRFSGVVLGENVFPAQLLSDAPAITINVEVDNVLAVRGGKIDPDRQPLANLLDACACVAIRCQNFPIGKIESNTPFIWRVRLVDLVASPNAKICSGLRSYPRRYSVPLILDEAGHLSGNRMQAILNGNGDTYRQLLEERNGSLTLSDDEVNLYVLQTTLAFAPEAKGLRTHNLYYDATLLPILKRLGLEYDCSYQMPLLEGLRPFWKTHDIVEIPTFYADHFDIEAGATGFEIDRLGLNRPGLKVLDFHPNIVFLNASCNNTYVSTKGFYHDHERLLQCREAGKGLRTLLIDLLETVAKRRLPTATVGEINAAWRSVAKWT